MNYKIILFFLFVLYSCVPIESTKKIKFTQTYENSGFALIYQSKLYENKIVSKKLDDRGLVIFQRNLKPKAKVKITNIINNKSIIATVGNKAKYPFFYNLVVSQRISENLELDIKEPYVSIVEIDESSTFIANKTKTFDEERNVAEKAPVEEIGIKDLSKDVKKVVDTNKITNFKYVIKIADFYYINTANLLKKRIINELGIKNVKINELSKTNFRVYLGPYNNLSLLEKNFNKILELEFENIEMIKL